MADWRMFWTFLRECGNGRRIPLCTEATSALSFPVSKQLGERKGAMRTISKHYIDGVFVESHRRELMDLIDPTTEKVIAQVR